MIDLTECRCEGQPFDCRHRGLFKDQRGRDLPGLARFVENLDWVKHGRYRPLRKVLEMDDDERTIRVQL